MLYEPDVYIMIIGGWVGIIVAGIAIYFAIKYPKMRRSPGDIFFMMSFIELIIAAHWEFIALRQVITGEPLEKGTFTCSFNGIISIYTAMVEYLYNTAFNYYILSKVKSSLKGNKIKSWRLHILVLLFGVIVATLATVFDLVGKTYYGTCYFEV